MLRVGLDLRATEQGFKAHAGRGTGRYVAEVTKAMKEIAEGENVSLGEIYSKDLVTSSLDSTIVNNLPLGRRTAESQWLFPRSVKRLQYDLVHFFSHGDASAWGGLPQVVSVLDLIPLKFPDLYKSEKSNLRFNFARYLEYEAVRKAVGIVAISEATKRDVVSILGVDEQKVVVTPLASDARFCPSKDSEASNELRAKHGLPLDRSMLVYVGGIDPRKNVPFLIEVLKEVIDRAKEDDLPFLVLAGRIESDDQFPLLLETIKRLGVEEHVYRLGFVPDEDLPVLYQSADLSIFPSLYEGFGLPVLESMACGTPVIAGANSSIPEVLGDSVPTMPDKEVGAWAEAVIRYLSNEDLLKEASGRCLEQSKKFSWERTAKSTLGAYRQFSGR